MNAATGLSVVIAGVCFAVASREWSWRGRHPYDLGPSGYIVALGVGGVLVCLALGLLIREINNLERERHQARSDYLALRKRVAKLDGQYVEPYDTM
jgi:hypothetical protein